MAATTTGIEPTGSDNKAPRQRSAAYPSYTIESCIIFTGKIDRAFSSVAFTPQESISKMLEQSGGAFLMQLSSCVQYGLLEKSAGEGYKPSALYKKIAKPLPTEKIEDAKLECFGKPKLYAKLIEVYGDKQIPAESGLANILDRLHGVIGNAAATAAKVFYKNLNDLKLLGDGNVLKTGGYIPFEEEMKDEEPENKDQSKQAVVIPKDIPIKDAPLGLPAPGVKEILILLKGKGEAKLTLPQDFDDSDLKRVVKVLRAYYEDIED